MAVLWPGRCPWLACRKVWELSLGSQTSSPPALDCCTGLGCFGVAEGLCCRADPPSLVCADVADVGMRLEESVSMSHRPGWFLLLGVESQ